MIPGSKAPTEQFVGIITTIMKQEHIHDYK